MDCRTMRWSLTIALLLALPTLGRSAAAGEPNEPTQSAESAELPRTADDHLALASAYREKTAAYKREAATHRQMAEAYKRSHPDLKGHGRNPWTVKMEKHCQAIARAAAELAAETEKAAEYHTLRARELHGQ
jgi:hypothetical protein